MATKTIKLVKGQKYACPQFPSETGGVVHRGDTVTLPTALADSLLEETYLDALNNVHHYFKDVTDGEAESDGEEVGPEEEPDEEEAAPVKSKVSRTQRKK